MSVPLVRIQALRDKNDTLSSKVEFICTAKYHWVKKQKALEKATFSEDHVCVASAMFVRLP